MRSGSGSGYSRATTAAVGGLTLLALLLRLPSLAERSLWLDEAWLANLVLTPSWGALWDEMLGRTLGSVRVAPVPPLFVLALRAVALLTGRSELGLRLLPLAASVGCVPIGYFVARRARGGATGIAAAVCFACLPVAVRYGQELKPYASDALLVLVLLSLAQIIARRSEEGWCWGALAVAASLVPGASYPATLVLPGIALALVPACRTRRSLALWTATHAGALALNAVWYLTVIGPQRARPLIASYWEAGFPPAGEPLVPWIGTRATELTAFFLGTPTGPLLVATIAGFLLARRLALVAGMTGALALAAAILRVYPLAADRTSLYLLPFFCLSFAAAVGALAGLRIGPRSLRWVGPIAAVVLLLWPARGSVSPQAGLIREEVAPLVRRLAAERGASDRVYVYCGAVPAFLFYGPTVGFESERDPAVVLGGVHRDNPAAYGGEIQPMLTPGRRLWVLFSHVAPAADGGSERDAILRYLSLYARSISAEDAPGASLYLFEVVSAPGAVRHLKLEAGDLDNPERLRELLGPALTMPTPRP